MLSVITAAPPHWTAVVLIIQLIGMAAGCFMLAAAHKPGQLYTFKDLAVIILSVWMIFALFTKVVMQGLIGVVVVPLCWLRKQPVPRWLEP